VGVPTAPYGKTLKRYDNENFSGQDKSVAKFFEVPVYVTTPGKSMILILIRQQLLTRICQKTRIHHDNQYLSKKEEFYKKMQVDYYKCIHYSCCLKHRMMQ